MKKWILLDWESASGKDLTVCGAYRYAQDPTTELLCGSLRTKTARALWHPGLPVPALVHQAIAEGWTWVAHNTQFERVIWRNIATPDWGWPECPPLELWHDTLSRALMLALPAGLEDVLRVMNLKARKDTEGSSLTIGLSKIDTRKTIPGEGRKRMPNPRFGSYPLRDADTMARVYAYCDSDTDGEMELHQRLGWLPECEREPWIMAQEMNDRGIYLDMDFVAACQTVVDKVVPVLTQEFFALTGLKVASPRFKDWLADRGVALENLQKATIAELLDDTEDDSDAEEWEEGAAISARAAEDLPANVRRALSIKQLIGSASIKKLKTMNEVVCFDGRARGMLIYHGTTPGRQTAKLIQPHNFPKPTIKVDGKGHDPQDLVDAIKMRDPEWLELMYGKGAVEVVVSGLRHAICAEPGSRLLSGDYSGIQARVVLALAGEHEKTAMMAGGQDIYCDMASQLYKREIDKERDPKERGVGKNCVLGLGFQMGPPTFFTKYGAGQTLEFCQEAVRVYRKEWAPGVPQLWYALQDAAIDTVWTGRPHEAHGIVYRREDEWLTAEVPNGRGSKLWYKNPIQNRRAMPWDADDVRKGFSYQVWKKGQWVWRDAFGGQLTENVVMKIEREIMEDAKRRLKAAGYPVVLEVHDENLAELPYGKGSLDEYQRLLEDVPAWVHALRIPIQVDCWEGERYRK